MSEKITTERIRQFYMYATGWNMDPQDHMIEVSEALAKQFDDWLEEYTEQIRKESNG